MKERSLFIQKFEQIAREDPRILSAFLGGSLADGTKDDFSDIDIYYILDEQSYPEFPTQMRTRLGEMGPLVLLEQHNNFGFDLILFIFQNGVKGELGLGTAKNLKTLHAGPYKVLVDKRGLLEGFVFPFQASLEGKDLQEYVEKQLRWYWYWYYVFLSAVARGRLWITLGFLDSVTCLRVVDKPHGHYDHCQNHDVESDRVTSSRLEKT